MTKPPRTSHGRTLRRAVLAVCVYAASATQPWTLGAQGARDTSGTPAIRVDDLREWLGYLASDELQGRQVFTEGYGLAAQYVASHLAAWGLTPLGSGGTYLQPVRLRGYAVTRNSSVRVTAGGETTTFTHGEHVTFSNNAGGPQTLTFDSVEFLGYGQPADLEGHDLKGKLIVTVPNMAPPPPRGGGPGGRSGGAGANGAEPRDADDGGRGGGGDTGGRGGADQAEGRGAQAAAGGRGAAGGGRGGRGGNAAVIEAGAPAAVSLTPPPPEIPAEQQALADAQRALQEATAALTRAQQAARGRGGRGRGEPPRQADFTTVQNVENLVQPQFTGDDTFFEALFAGSPVSFADVKAAAQKGEPLQAVSLPAEVTVTIDNTYEVVSQRLTNNVVGLVEGSDPVLRNTYILLGAHLDHAGYSQTATARLGSPDACRRRSSVAQEAVTAAGRTVQRPTDGGRGARGRQGGDGDDEPAVPFDERDAILNGADDDGSGSTALMAIARAFATGPRPRRSVVFVWHAGEESGLFGSRYNADFPVVPIDAVQAHLNLDMVGRNDCDNLEGDHGNTLFVVGADRISTALHNTIVETNAALDTPLRLDYELNDADDPENVYRRSDHYSYAAKGIPVAFFTTGLHPDYHRVTDAVDKIEFEKMARVADLIYRTGLALANRDAPLERDNRGPRTGFGSPARVLPAD